MIMLAARPGRGDSGKTSGEMAVRKM